MKRTLIIAWMLFAPAAHAAAKGPVTIHLAGDSTMAEKLPEKRPETGWGEALHKFFRADRVRVMNHAKNGRSTRLFIEQKHWQTLLDALREGDFVFIQFGHNDAAADRPDRYTPPAEYRANLARFVREVRERKATPVLFTPVMRRRFTKAGVFQDAHGAYPDIVREVAAELKAPLIDMHRMSERVLVGYGPEESRKLFLQLKPGESPNYPKGVEDNTHFNARGAEEMAALAVEGIRGRKLALAKHLLKTRRVHGSPLPRPPRRGQDRDAHPRRAADHANRVGRLRELKRRADFGQGFGRRSGGTCS